MINPSTIGWIDKFFATQNFTENHTTSSPLEFYKNIRSTGLIYGHIVSVLNTDTKVIKSWTSEEISKMTLLTTLLEAYKQFSSKIIVRDFVSEVLGFYDEMNNSTIAANKNRPTEALEKIISERIQTNDNIVSKNFSSIHTNALLFIDVIAFQQYLIKGEIPNKYLKKIEEAIVSIVSIGLKIKSKKTDYDILVTKLFETSVRHTKFSDVDTANLSSLKLDYFKYKLEKFYLLDMAQLSIWQDQENEIDSNENQYIKSISTLLKIEKEVVAESATAINDFIEKYKTEIPFFTVSSPVKNFYDHTSEKVKVLVSRNKNRLSKELANNSELLSLLKASTLRTLDVKEKKKIRKQLLEICKTIPSLTIFLLPGGSLLLPFLIKYIPKFVPSIFNENLAED